MSPSAKARVSGAWVDTDLVGAYRLGGVTTPFAPPDDPPAGETLFGDTVPVDLDLTDGTAYTMGTRFTPAVNGEATHGRWHFPTTIPHASNPVLVGIYRNSDEVLLGWTEFPLGATLGAWNQVAYSSPIALTAGTEYTTVIHTPARYVASGSFHAITKNNGANLNMPTIAGRFSAGPYGSFQFPGGSYNAGGYFPDLAFVPA